MSLGILFDTLSTVSISKLLCRFLLQIYHGSLTVQCSTLFLDSLNYVEIALADETPKLFAISPYWFQAFNKPTTDYILNMM